MTHPPGLSDSLALFPLDEAEPKALGPGRLPSYIADHRARLRARFAEAGAQALPDYELLELLLFRIIPRQDVKPIAHRLLDMFGDVASVLSAPTLRLEQVQGVGPAVALELKVVEAVAHRMAPACCAAMWCPPGTSSSTTATPSWRTGSRSSSASSSSIARTF